MRASPLSTLRVVDWHIGYRVRLDILKEKRAEYGKNIVSALGRQLEQEFGRGFSEKSLRHMVRSRTARATHSTRKQNTQRKPSHNLLTDVTQTRIWNPFRVRVLNGFECRGVAPT